MSSTLAKDSSIFIAGHRGLVGSAIVRRLRAAGFINLLTTARSQLDLRDPSAVDAWFKTHRPQYVFLVAGTVGGIHANATRPVDFLYDNLLIHASVLRAAHEHGVEKLLYLGSSCIYPRDCPQPMQEEHLLTGPLETTNEAYALAKISGIKLCQAYRRQFGRNFIAAMPTNLYGPNDNFDLESSHVLPAMIRKFHDAKMTGSPTVTLWGTGSPRREFLHVDDLADACLFLMENYNDELFLNVGTGEDISIRDLANVVRELVYPQAEIVWDSSKPDGTPRKLLNVDRVHALGWRHRIELADGIQSTYGWYCQHVAESTASHKTGVTA